MIKLLGVAVGFFGILMNLLDLRGCFVEPEKRTFGELVMNTDELVPRTTPGFELFLRDFPPPSGVASVDVTHIGDKALRWDTSPAESLAVVYVANGIRSSPVARLDQVRDWANATIYGWLSWLITVVGWLLYAVIEFVKLARERREKRMPPNNVL
jgi:hypothetical protein